MKKYRIMTVEDNEFFAMVLDYNMKEELGYSLINVTSGEDCIDQLDWNPDLIILDYSLPGLSGLETLKKIKKIKPKIKVFVLSNQTDVQVAVDFINAGAEKYIKKKDFSIKNLMTDIEEIRFN